MTWCTHLPYNKARLRHLAVHSDAGDFGCIGHCFTYHERNDLAMRYHIIFVSAGRQQHRVNVPADSISAYWRRAM